LLYLTAVYQPTSPAIAMVCLDVLRAVVAPLH
jgi:hypothetical protein